MTKPPRNAMTTVPLSHLSLAWAAIVAVMLVLDALWLGGIARPMYQSGIGHLMAEQPKWLAAALFYAVYAVGLMVFAVGPEAQAAAHSGGAADAPVGDGPLLTAMRAALFGAVAYATYDFTNLATLRGWPWGLALLDLTWGAVISAVAAVAARALVLHRLLG